MQRSTFRVRCSKFAFTAGTPGLSTPAPSLSLSRLSATTQSAPSLRRLSLPFVVALGSLLLLVHNHAISLLPDEARLLTAGELQSVHPAAVPVASARLPGWPDNDQFSQRSRVQLLENGKPLILAIYRLEPVLDFGQGRWVHREGRIIFTASDNSDPRTNGRTYSVRHPIAYGPAWSWLGLAGFSLSLALLWRGRPHDRVDAAAPSPIAAVRVHCALATLALAVGLYCNTGTLAPYAITHVPEPNPQTGYLYHIDQPHQKALFELLTGGDRSTWADTVLLRRILFPLLIWPFAAPFGFEIGGVMALLFWNTLGFAAWLVWVRRRWGDRAAVAAGWLGAFYPGVAFWGGLPQVYGLIFPLALLLTATLHEIAEANPRRVAWLSLLLGVGYLGYDFFVFFLPASLLLLARRKAWTSAIVSGVLQIAPLATWILLLRFALEVPANNANTAVYGRILAAYFHPADYAAWGHLVMQVPAIFADVFFGANFLFLPWLFLGLLLLRTTASRPLLTRAEAALLLAAAALFFFNNLAPDYGGDWPMRGSWIARLYQPIFVVFLGAAARWWAGEPVPARRQTLALLFAATCAANALIVFGPVANDPLRLSGHAYYRFYNHSENHWLYRFNLKRYGRHPLGW